MHQGYLSFLLDLTGRGTNRVVKDSVRYEPTPSQRPKTAFQWKIVVDVEGTVVVRGHEGTSYRVLGTARRSGDELADHRGRGATPNSFQWKLVEEAVRDELARATSSLRAHPTWVEDVEVDDLVDTTVEDVPIVDEPVPPRPRKLPTRLILAYVAAGALAIVVGAVAVKRSRSSAPAMPTPVAQPTVASDAASDVAIDAAPLTLEQQVATAPDLASALALARPAMDDAPSALSPGAKLVAQYASQRLRWADVGGASETTLDEGARGKRLCATGRVLSIARRDLEQREIHVGLLATDDHEALAFVAVGITAGIAKRSKATFCGVVTGHTDEAVSLVGMFDLPENRAPMVERER